MSCDLEVSLGLPFSTAFSGGGVAVTGAAGEDAAAETRDGGARDAGRLHPPRGLRPGRSLGDGMHFFLLRGAP